MTRPSDITRERILKAAERLFADRGYEETSIRAIVTKARVNQAAINYHSGARTASTAKSCGRLFAPSPSNNSPTHKR
jgi:Bacterial regulatory proteins, tetR family